MERQNRNTKSRAPLSVTLLQTRDISQSNGKTLTDTHATYRPGEENSPCPNQNYRIKLKQFHSIAVLRGKNCFESCIYRDRREWVSKWVAVPPRVRFFCLHSLKLSTVLAPLIPLLIFIFPSFPLRSSLAVHVRYHLRISASMRYSYVYFEDMFWPDCKSVCYLLFLSFGFLLARYFGTVQWTQASRR